MQFRSTGFTLILIIGASTSTPVVAQVSDTLDAVDDLVGCYALTTSSWSKTPPQSQPPLPPLALRLDTAMRPSSLRGYRYVAHVADSLTAEHPRSSAASWVPVGADSLEVITWLGRFDGEVLYLRPTSWGFTGVARRTSDAIPVDKEGRVRWDAWPWATISGQRVACEAAWPWPIR
jgi:hypothetical protein